MTEENINTDDKKIQTKKIIKPNECSIIRWILAAFVGYIIAQVVGGIILGLGIIFIPIIFRNNHNIFEYSVNIDLLITLIAFAINYLFLVLMLKIIAKVPVRDFIFGVGGKNNKKQNIIIALVFTISIILPIMIFNNDIELNDVSFNTVIANIIICILFVWMQTSYEEFLFRGIFLRFVCKNNLKFCLKTNITIVVSSLIFMVLHFSNPEIKTQKTTIDFICMAFAYCVSGLMFAVLDVHFNNLMPGLICHCLNNFWGLVLITSPVSVIKTPAIFITKTEPKGINELIFNIVLFLPFIVYLIYAKTKKINYVRKD